MLYLRIPIVVNASKFSKKLQRNKTHNFCAEIVTFLLPPGNGAQKKGGNMILSRIETFDATCPQ
jgi:hypothetical protein